MTSAPPTDRPASRFLNGPFAAQTWRELGYLSLHLLLTPFAFAYVVFVPSFAAAVLIIVVGLWLVGALVVGARGWCAVYRALARTVLGVDVAAPPPFVRPREFWSGLGAMFADVDGWRALLFMFLMFPLTIVSWVVSMTFLAFGLGAVTYGAWYRFLPLQQAYDGTWHRGASVSTDTVAWFVDTPPRIVALAAVGVVFLWLWPALQSGFVALFVALTRGLLGPSPTSVRVARLRASRVEVAEDAAVRLRQIERDLHDGTQARLVAVAMQLGEAREQIGPDGDPQLVALLGSAHTTAKETLVELRDIARGIHPPALDAGLAVALETLAAQSVVPVRLDVRVDEARPLSPSVSSIAYYTVAELVTNAAKHARACQIRVDIRQHDHTLNLCVSDDGRGGAQVHEPSHDGQRSGLAGLVERVRAVDGTFDLSSPLGGPTVVTVTLPADLGAADEVSGAQHQSEEYEARLAELKALGTAQWRRGLLWTFSVGYAVALFTCFVVNFAVDRTLSWFFVVLAAIATAFCVTTLPLLVQAGRRVVVSAGAFVLSLVTLLTVCWAFTGGGRWWAITVASLLLGFVVVLLPFVLVRVRVPAPWDRRRPLVCLAADTVGLFVLLLVAVDSTHVVSVALPVAAFTVPWVWAVVVVFVYLRADVRVRVATCVAIASVFALVAEPVIRAIATGAAGGLDVVNVAVYGACLVAALAYLGVRARRAVVPAASTTEQPTH
ncbi:MAG: sensor domain-containing protein [Micrococcales bacterium]|nr:sensor domain-containing protein [Micrococcales bacterium]